METIEYSELYLEKLMKDTLGLSKSKVIIWSWDYPFASDVRNVFKQTESEDEELIDYYRKYLNEKMTTMEKAKAIAMVVNNRTTYLKDIELWGKLDYWVSPYKMHKDPRGDCDDYSNLIVYVCRLFGVQPYEIFTRAGEVYNPYTKETFGHAHPIIFNKEDNQFYPIEGSFLPDNALSKFGVIPIQDNEIYNRETWFITNDLVSYSDYPILRFVH